MSLIRWNPFDEFDKLSRDVNRLFTTSPLASREGGAPDAGRFVPAVDIYEDDDKTELHVEVPGMDKEAIDVKVDNNILTIRGERKFDSEEKKGSYHRLERSYGMFERSFSLPDYVDADNIKGSYDQGVLVLSLPKLPKAQPKQIDISVK